jgi:hypothetical protein
MTSINSQSNGQNPGKRILEVNRYLRLLHSHTLSLLRLTATLLFLWIIGFAGCSPHIAAPEENSKSPLSQGYIEANSPTFAYWQHQFPGSQWAALAQGDLNNDKRDDLLIVYGTDKDKFSLVAVLDLIDGYEITEPIAAPVEDQVLSIFNMDDTPPNEFSVSGRKGAEVGSAIFHLENGTIRLLLTAGYGNCC